MIWSIIVGGFIGFIAGAITKKGGAMGIIANIGALSVTEMKMIKTRIAINRTTRTAVIANERLIT